MLKSVKKWLSFCLVIAMITSCMVITVSAEEFQFVRTKAGSPTSGNPGDTLSVLYEISDARNMKGIDGKLYYDADAFEVDNSIDWMPPSWAEYVVGVNVYGDIVDNRFNDAMVVNANNPGVIEFSLARISGAFPNIPVIGAKTLFVVHFKIKADAEDGVYPITFADVKAGDGAAVPNPITLGAPQASPITVGEPGGDPVDPDVSWPTISAITYGDTFADALGDDGSADTEGVFTIEDAGVAPDAGTYSKVVTFTPAVTDDYNVVTQAFDVVVNKADQAAPSISVSKTTDSVTITAVSGAVYGLKVKDTAGDVSYGDNNVFSGLDSKTTYTAYIKLAATDNLNESPVASVDVTTDATANDDVNDDTEDLDYTDINFDGVDERTGENVPQDKDNVVGKINLPTEGNKGSTINWSSDKPNVVRNNGVVIRPAFVDGDQTVTLTATVGKGGATPKNKNFTVTVKALPAPPSMAFDKFNADSPVIKVKGPSDVAIDSLGNIIITDSMNNRVLKYDATGALIAEYGELGAGVAQFAQPMGVAVGADDSIYVADALNNRIVKFKDANSDGDIEVSEWTEYGSNGSGVMEFNNPAGVFVNGTKVYVADTKNHRIAIFDTVDGGYWATIGSKGTDENQFRYPMDVAVDAVGDIWVADLYNNIIKRFTASGEFVIGYGAELPYGIAADAEGNVYATQRTAAKILCVNNTSEYAGKGALANQFANPTGITVDGDGNVWAVDVTKNVVKKAARQEQD